MIFANMQDALAYMDAHALSRSMVSVTPTFNLREGMAGVRLVESRGGLHVEHILEWPVHHGEPRALTCTVRSVSPDELYGVLTSYSLTALFNTVFPMIDSSRGVVAVASYGNARIGQSFVWECPQGNAYAVQIALGNTGRRWLHADLVRIMDAFSRFAALLDEAAVPVEEVSTPEEAAPPPPNDESHPDVYQLMLD